MNSAVSSEINCSAGNIGAKSITRSFKGSFAEPKNVAILVHPSDSKVHLGMAEVRQVKSLTQRIGLTTNHKRNFIQYRQRGAWEQGIEYCWLGCQHMEQSDLTVTESQNGYQKLTLLGSESDECLGGILYFDRSIP